MNALDANPRDGSLLMNTNVGLFRIALDGRAAWRVEARVDAAPSPVAIGRAGLAFTFTGPDCLLGSGTPTPEPCPSRSASSSPRTPAGAAVALAHGAVRLPRPPP